MTRTKDWRPLTASIVPALALITFLAFGRTAAEASHADPRAWVLPFQQSPTFITQGPGGSTSHSSETTVQDIDTARG